MKTGFSATIPTICRTGDKLSGSQNQIDSKACVLCKGILVNLTSPRYLKKVRKGLKYFFRIPYRQVQSTMR
jgi:hypothetical protein